jgi:purine-binding chemotaxis protein CheW
MHAGGQLVVVRVSESTLAALPLEAVLETMRPLGCQPLDGAPPFVAGASVVRGVPTPVVDLRVFLGLPDEGLPARRWVTIGIGQLDREAEGARGSGIERVVALAVRDVVGVRGRAGLELASAPLLSSSVRSAASSLAVLDGALLVVLEASRMIDDATLRRLDVALQGRPAPGVIDAQ